jgi:hypothetical protein
MQCPSILSVRNCAVFIGTCLDNLLSAQDFRRFLHKFYFPNFTVQLMDFVVIVKPVGIGIERLGHVPQSLDVLPAAIGYLLWNDFLILSSVLYDSVLLLVIL